MFPDVLLLLLTLSIAAFFAGLETGIITFRSSFNPERHPSLAGVYNDLSRVVVVILIFTNIATISFSSLAGYLFWKMGAKDPALLSSLVLTPVSFTFGEVLPKTLFRKHARRVIPFLSWFLKILVRLSQFIPPVFGKFGRSVFGEAGGRVSIKPRFTLDEMRFYFERVKKAPFDTGALVRLWRLVRFDCEDRLFQELTLEAEAVLKDSSLKIRGVPVPIIKIQGKNFEDRSGEFFFLLERMALESPSIKKGNVDFLVVSGEGIVGVFSLIKGFMKLDDVIIKWEDGMDLWDVFKFFEEKDVSLSVIDCSEKGGLRLVLKEPLERVFVEFLCEAIVESHAH